MGSFDPLPGSPAIDAAKTLAKVETVSTSNNRLFFKDLTFVFFEEDVVSFSTGEFAVVTESNQGWIQVNSIPAGVRLIRNGSHIQDIGAVESD